MVVVRSKTNAPLSDATPVPELPSEFLDVRAPIIVLNEAGVPNLKNVLCEGFAVVAMKGEIQRDLVGISRPSAFDPAPRSATDIEALEGLPLTLPDHLVGDAHFDPMSRW